MKTFYIVCLYTIRYIKSFLINIKRLSYASDATSLISYFSHNLLLGEVFVSVCRTCTCSCFELILHQAIVRNLTSLDL